MLALPKDLANRGEWMGTLNPTVVTGIVAAGNASQANATALTGAINIVSTAVAGVTDSVRLPVPGFIGQQLVVVNDDDGTLKVYPATGGVINAAAANAVFNMATLTSAVFVAVSATRWVAVATV